MGRDGPPGRPFFGPARARPNHLLQNLWNSLYSRFRSEFFNYAVGPWVSVA